MSSAVGVEIIGRGGTPSYLSGSQTYGGITGTFYSCSTDLCNGATVLSSSLGLALSFVATLFVLKWTMINH